MRFDILKLQIAEVVNSMKDLIDYSRQTRTGPMGMLFLILLPFFFDSTTVSYTICNHVLLKLFSLTCMECAGNYYDHSLCMPRLWDLVKPQRQPTVLFTGTDPCNHSLC